MAAVGVHRKYCCRPCDKAVVGQDAKKIGHFCWLHLVAHGKGPLLNEHTKKDAEIYTVDFLQAKAEHLLATKLSKIEKQPRNAAKHARNVNVNASISMSVNYIC